MGKKPIFDPTGKYPTGSGKYAIRQEMRRAQGPFIVVDVLGPKKKKEKGD